MNRADIDRMPGLKRKDIEGCAACGKGIAHNSDITFYRMNLERFILDPGAIEERHGMELMMGGGTAGAMLAEVMGPNRDLAKRVAGPMVMIICEPCAMGGEFEMPATGDRPRSWWRRIFGGASQVDLRRRTTVPCLAALAEGWTERQERTADAKTAG